MRYVIYGAGAIGGAIGGRLVVSGHDVVLIARGAHLQALQRDGLELSDPETTQRLQIEAVGSPGEIDLRPDDCVIVATKSQQTESALDDLRAAAGELAGQIAVVCAQNGVENERTALRRFERVYGMRVILAGTHLQPGVVQISTAPVYGVLDVGRFPHGRDDCSDLIARDLVEAGFDARSTDDVMSFKYLKLLSNLGNSLDAATGSRSANETARAVFQAARQEATECFAAAGIAVADEAEDEVRRRTRGGPQPVKGVEHRGSSSWQSLRRGTGNIEADYLNGEIALLGRTYGIATPVNVYLQELANRLARERRPAGSVPIEEIGAALREAVPALAGG